MKTSSHACHEPVRAKAGTARKRPPLRVPVVGPEEGMVGLTVDERAIIAEAKAQRALRGWSQEELARRVGVKRSTWQHIEHHRSGFSFRVALGIVRAFDSGVDFFLEAGKKRLFSPKVGARPGDA